MKIRRKWPVSAVVAGTLARWIGTPTFAYGGTWQARVVHRRKYVMAYTLGVIFHPTEERAY